MVLGALRMVTFSVYLASVVPIAVDDLCFFQKIALHIRTAQGKKLGLLAKLGDWDFAVWNRSPDMNYAHMDG